MEIEKGRAVSSVKNYDHYLQVFASFAKKNEINDPAGITQDLVRQFRLNLNRDASVGKNTQNYYLIALRSYLKYLNRRGVKSLDATHIELAKNDERQITFLEDEELENLLNQPDSSSIQGIRDKAILNLLFSTGLRVSEIAALKKDNINLEKKEFSVKGKGGKIRVVFLDESARIAVKKYLDVRTDKADDLFLSYGHTKSQNTIHESQITPRSIQRMIKKYATAAGITKDVTPHVLRHSFATDLLMNGADLRAVQSLLGHSSITTTQIYTHVTDQHLQDVHEAFHGRRRRLSDNEKEASDESARPE